MLNIKHLLRLKCKGHSNRELAELLGINRNTVNRYMRLFKSSGKSYEELCDLDAASLLILVEQENLHVEATQCNERLAKLESYFSDFSKEMKKVGATYQGLWERYCSEVENPYAYTQFRHYFKAYLARFKVSMRWEHKYGDKLLMDFAGKKLPIVDRLSGELVWKEVFIGILAGSGYTYVRAVESQKLDDFLEAVQDCLHFFGGVPRLLVPDNLKSAVHKANDYEADVNRNFKALALHYHTAPSPTRALAPKDKALVEGAVKLVYQQIYRKLDEYKFFSLQELNQSIREKLDDYNNRLYQHRTYSRKDLFDQYEKAVLEPLPTSRFERRTYREGRVNKDAHVQFDYHYYSVPYMYAKQRIFVQASARVVEVFISKTHERIAIHARQHKRGGFSTKSEHLPPNVRFVKDWSVEQFSELAQEIGQPTYDFFLKIFDSKAHPELAYKACMGVLSLQKGFSNARINAACERAAYFHNYTYKAVKNILEKGLDNIQYRANAHSDDHKQVLDLDHPNIRGGEYYK